MTAPETCRKPARVRREIPASAIESWWTAPDGTSVRRIDWPAPEWNPRGSILFMPGRGDAYEKWIETLDGWYSEGWAVTSADWRGQALSGRFGSDSFTGHVDDFAVWVDDLAALWNSWHGKVPGPASSLRIRWVGTLPCVR